MSVSGGTGGLPTSACPRPEHWWASHQWPPRSASTTKRESRWTPMRRPIAPMVLAASLLAFSAARATDYHLGNDGDDDAEGTSEAPWRTLSRASRHAFAPGDRLLLRGGEAFDGNLEIAAPASRSDPSMPITVGSDGPGRALIRAGGGTGVRIEDLGGVVVRDLDVVGGGPEGNDGFGRPRDPPKARRRSAPRGPGSPTSRPEASDGPASTSAASPTTSRPSTRAAGPASSTSGSPAAAPWATSTTASTSTAPARRGSLPTPTGTSSSSIAWPPATSEIPSTPPTTAATASCWGTPRAA